MNKVNKEAIDKAIWAHSRWKRHLQEAIASGHSQFLVEEVNDPTQCKFGEWLYSKEGRKLLNFKEVETLHRQFHQEGARILKLVTTGQIEQAKIEIELGSHFGQLTAQLVETLVKIKHTF